MINNKTYWKCTKCGHRIENTNIPAKCPICNKKKWAIEQLVITK